MKVELKNIKVYEKLSEETVCFTATIYLNGKRAGEVENRGQGGNTCYHFFQQADEQAFDVYVRSLPPKEFKARPDMGVMESWKRPTCGEDIFDDLLSVHFQAKEEKKLSKIDAKCKVDFTAKGFPVAIRLTLDGRYAWTAATTEERIADAVAAYESRYKTKVLSWKRV